MKFRYYTPFALFMVLNSGNVLSQDLAPNSTLNNELDFDQRLEQLEKEFDSRGNFNYAGYFRGGWETSTNGSPNATVYGGYERPNWAQGGLGRFGNEFYGWYDLVFSQRFYEQEKKSIKAVVVMDGQIDLNSAGNSFNNNNNNNDFGFSDLYVSMKGFIPNQEDAEFWVGRHNLPAKIIMMFDWKYDAILGASGIGMEKLKFGVGTLDWSLTRTDYDVKAKDKIYKDEKINTNNVHIRYRDIALTDSTSLNFFSQALFANKTDTEKERAVNGEIYDLKNSFMLGASLHTNFSSGGFNDFIIQGANNGIATNMARIHGPNPYLAHGGVYRGDQSGGSLIRLTSQGEEFFSDNYVIAHAISVAKGSDIVDPELAVVGRESAHSDIEYFRSAVRPAYIWGNNNQTGFEFGYFIQNSEIDGKKLTEEGFKTTIYHSIKFGKSNYSSRPEIRFYTTYLKALENDLDDVYFGDGDDYQIKLGVKADVLFF